MGKKKAPKSRPKHLDQGKPGRSSTCFSCQKTFKKTFLCKRCEVALYCSTECQKAHWAVHKEVCVEPPQDPPQDDFRIPSKEVEPMIKELRKRIKNNCPLKLFASKYVSLGLPLPMADPNGPHSETERRFVASWFDQVPVLAAFCSALIGENAEKKLLSAKSDGLIWIDLEIQGVDNETYFTRFTLVPADGTESGYAFLPDPTKDPRFREKCEEERRRRIASK